MPSCFVFAGPLHPPATLDQVNCRMLLSLRLWVDWRVRCMCCRLRHLIPGLMCFRGSMICDRCMLLLIMSSCFHPRSPLVFAVPIVTHVHGADDVYDFSDGYTEVSSHLQALQRAYSFQCCVLPGPACCAGRFVALLACCSWLSCNAVHASRVIGVILMQPGNPTTERCVHRVTPRVPFRPAPSSIVLTPGLL